MITKLVKTLARVAWIGWTVVGLTALIATYGPWEPLVLPKGTPHMIRLATPGAQDSSAAGIALFRFREWSGFGHREALTGNAQYAPVPVIIFLFLLLGFIDINIGGPKVGKRPEA